MMHGGAMVRVGLALDAPVSQGQMAHRLHALADNELINTIRPLSTHPADFIGAGLDAVELAGFGAHRQIGPDSAGGHQNMGMRIAGPVVVDRSRDAHAIAVGNVAGILGQQLVVFSSIELDGQS